MNTTWSCWLAGVALNPTENQSLVFAHLIDSVDILLWKSVRRMFNNPAQLMMLNTYSIIMLQQPQFCMYFWVFVCVCLYLAVCVHASVWKIVYLSVVVCMCVYEREKECIHLCICVSSMLLVICLSMPVCVFSLCTLVTHYIYTYMSTYICCLTVTVLLTLYGCYHNTITYSAGKRLWTYKTVTKTTVDNDEMGTTSSTLA